MQNLLTQHKNIFTNFVFPGLVNRTRKIATLEDKANLTGFRWTLPQKIPQGFIENHSRNGEFLHNARTAPVSIRDVDGRDKHTICTAYYEQDQLTLKEKPKPAVGEWVEGLSRSVSRSQLTKLGTGAPHAQRDYRGLERRFCLCAWTFQSTRRRKSPLR